MTIVAGIDIETTGLEQPEGHRIIEVAAVLYELESQRELGRYETRINPQRGVDPKAQAVHGISLEMLVDKPVWGSIAPKLASLLSRCHYVVAHNGEEFDMPFIYGEFLRVGVALPVGVRIIDTMKRGRWATHDGAVPNLGALCFAADVPYDKSRAHGATYDVEVLMKCFFKAQTFFMNPAPPVYEFKPQITRKDKK